MPQDKELYAHCLPLCYSLGDYIVAYFVRLYRTRTDHSTWFSDESIYDMVLAYPDRFLLGSDTWVNQRWQYYEDIMAQYRAWLGDLPPDVARKIAWDNGARVFGVK